MTPFYNAVHKIAVEKKGVALLDVGANEVENLSNFVRDVEFADDAATWGISVLCFVPFYPLDPESTTQSAFTIRRLRKAAPNLRFVLVENRHGGSSERIVARSIGETNLADLMSAAAGAERIVMPAIAREYWAPFEGAGIRFIKALALSPQEGAQQLGRSIAEVKIMKSVIARFWRPMHEQFAQIIHLPKGSE